MYTKLPNGSPRSGGGKKKAKIIEHMRTAMDEGRTFYSFEFFPPKTKPGVENLFARIDGMSLLGPTFMDVTWGAGGATADLTLEISASAQNYTSAEVMMHLTCTNMDEGKVKDALEKARDAGIKNILALRGDPPRGQENWESIDSGFEHAVDLVRYIKEHHGDYFGVAVAGYPEMHINAVDMEADIQHLKEKVDAGADFIITQLFYDVEKFLQWVEMCRTAGIECPIIPGIMPIQNYNGFKRMVGFCKTSVPQDILSALEPIKDDDAKVKQYGVELGISMCKHLLEAGVPGLHFYTLNLQLSVVRILAGLGFVTLDHSDKLPWVPSKLSNRKKEDVRPIFWANRPASYLTRTQTWDEFPNGRWGDHRSPAFGDLSDYHLVGFKTGSMDERLRDWGTPTCMADIHEVFAKYIDGRVPKLPWCETSVHRETVPLKALLLCINRAGFMTINSQPRVNGAPSAEAAVGWGGSGGYVYQKAYVEFFTSPENWELLTKEIEKFPSLSYHAIRADGKSMSNARSQTGVNAVTWGVFPDREVLQPTVVDPESFVVWKDEAFALWESQWASLYPPQSETAKLFDTILNTYYLVNIVDNDYVNGDIFECFQSFIH